MAPGTSRTRPARQCGTIPINEVMPTRTSEVVVACFGVWPGPVHERGDGEDRPAAAERPERQADQEARAVRSRMARQFSRPPDAGGAGARATQTTGERLVVDHGPGVAHACMPPIDVHRVEALSAAAMR